MDRAIEERVDLLLVAGDLVDQANRYYEAAGAVEAGVRSLVARGIRTLAVSGNHDHDTLPWIASRFSPDEFRLLGQGGRWERHTVERNGSVALHVDAWSFPAAVVLDDPLGAHPRHPHDGIPVLGLVHGDLDQPGSRHAPLSLATLRALPTDFWLLGHIHRPTRDVHAGAATVLYPGSPQAMDPGEPGVHGPWLLTIDQGGRFEVRQLPLSTIRYEAIEVDVEGVEEEGEVDRRVVAAVHTTLESVEAEAGPLEHLSLRVRLTGRTRLHRSLQVRSWEEASGLEARCGEMRGGIERVEVATRPARDLQALARGQDAPALLARLVRNLERGIYTPHEEELVRSTLLQVEQVCAARQYLPLDDAANPFPEARVRKVLREHALLLLDELLTARESS